MGEFLVDGLEYGVHMDEGGVAQGCGHLCGCGVGWSVDMVWIWGGVGQGCGLGVVVWGGLCVVVA